MYDEMMRINPDNLAGEWLNQPGLYQEVAHAAADADLALDHAKDALDVLAAQTETAIRANPEAYGIAKLTEGAIKCAMEINPEYRKAHASVLQAKNTAALVKGTLVALDHRKKALENLVQLQLAGLRADPKAAGVSTAETKREQSAGVQSAINSRLNANPRRRAVNAHTQAEDDF